MYASTSDIAVRAQRLAQSAAMIVFSLIGAGLFVCTMLSASGILPWPELAISWGGQPVPMAGAIAQIAFTALFLLLMVFLPANARILRLEASHRKFQLSMEDVAKAYAVAHAADRTGVFRLQSEFDAVRERLAFLREHADLGHMEPEILEVAAQMSRVSEELAEVYADEKVERAKAFLQERMTETEALKTRIDRAAGIAADLRRMTDRVEMEEDIVISQVQRLRRDLEALMPAIDGAADRAGRKDAAPAAAASGGAAPATAPNVVRIAGE